MSGARAAKDSQFSDILQSAQNIEEADDSQKYSSNAVRERAKKPEDQGLPDENEKHFVLVGNPICRRFFFLIRLIGALIMLINLIADISYAFKQEFSSSSYFFAYISVLGLRLLIPIILGGVYLRKYVVGKRPVAFQYDLDLEQRKSLQKRYWCAGFLLYTALSLLYITGSYRVLKVRDFVKNVATGFAIDTVYMLGAFFVQALNNSTLQVSEVEKSLATDLLQFICIMCKLAVLADLLLEMLMFCFEIYKLHNLERQSVDVVVRFSEERRRKVYAQRYFNMGNFCVVALAAASVALAFVLPSRNCNEH